MNRTILLANRHTNETQEISFEEFKIKFANELRSAIEIYSTHARNKDYLSSIYPNKNIDYTSDFYLDIRWNFNNYSNSAWYISKIY